MTTTVRFRDLGDRSARALLRRGMVGRIAYTFRDRVDVEPIAYHFDGRWIYLRTSKGAKLTKLRHHPWVAFEVDEIEDVWNWKSVVAHGTVYSIDDAESAVHDTAVRAVRRYNPTAFTPADPAPERTILLRIHVDAIHGRSASQRPVQRRRR